jgi:hypothetical protein
VHSSPDRKPLDEAARDGMYGWVTVGSIKPEKRDEDEKRIRSIVSTLKDHPALLFWETEDEPSFVWKEPKDVRITPAVIRDTYRFVKSLDPVHPLYLNHSPTNLVTTLRQYDPGGDLIATDIYPVAPAGLREQYALWPDGRQGDLLNSTISQVGQYADKMRQVAGASRGLFMVLQGFAWEMLRDKDRDPRHVLYPSLEETRFMAYQSIVHGVTGLIWWGLHKTPPESGLWEHIAATARELKHIALELAAAPQRIGWKIEYHDTGHSLDRGIEWIVKPSGAGSLLIALNADKNPVECTFAGLAGYRGIEVLFEKRAVRLDRGTLRDEFAPFAARVYRLSK